MNFTPEELAEINRLVEDALDAMGNSQWEQNYDDELSDTYCSILGKLREEKDKCES